MGRAGSEALCLQMGMRCLLQTIQNLLQHLVHLDHLEQLVEHLEQPDHPEQAPKDTFCFPTASSSKFWCRLQSVSFGAGGVQWKTLSQGHFYLLPSSPTIPRSQFLWLLLWSWLHILVFNIISGVSTYCVKLSKYLSDPLHLLPDCWLLTPSWPLTTWATFPESILQECGHAKKISNWYWMHQRFDCSAILLWKRNTFWSLVGTFQKVL